MLVDAEYAALGVINEDGHGQGLAYFIVVGVAAKMSAKIGSLPAGHGVLCNLITDPDPLRLARPAAHPESFGFPPNHPPIRTFMGVPAYSRNRSRVDRRLRSTVCGIPTSPGITRSAADG